METQEDIYTKSEVSNIKCETQLENDDVNNTEFPVTIKNEFKQELLILEDNTANEDFKDWFNQMNTEIFIENVKQEQIEGNSNLLTCKNLKCEPNIKDNKDVIEENQSQCDESNESEYDSGKETVLKLKNEEDAVRPNL
ncbi:uncharacterized protein [Diabrotica undecimpunctata]|uniref:uncharacterized protein isoform X3 n=1 Tax=Diabrotica undecimpunctata TaxID=50387 RepID=UPI003B634BF8